MASRGKQKQFMRPKGGQMRVETDMAAAMSKAEIIRAAMQADSSFSAQRQNHQQAMSVNTMNSGTFSRK